MRRSLLVSCAIGGLALAAGCGRVHETEPNDSPDRATPVHERARIVGTVASAADVDAYRLEVLRESGVLSAHVAGIRDADFVLTFLDKDQNPLKKVDETGAGGDERLLDLGVAKGSYFIVLSNSNPKAANPDQKYELQLRVDPAEGSELEPDDRPLQATLLAPGTTTRGHYFPRKDLLDADGDQVEDDWFRVKVDQAGVFRLDLEVSEVPGVDAVLEVYDANAYKVKEVDLGGPGEPESLKNYGVRGPAEVVLRLRPKSKQMGNDEVAYGIVTQLLPYEGKVEFEPNDQRLEATPLTVERVEGSIAPAGDQDWYKVAVDTAGPKQVLRAEVSPLAGMDLVLKVFDEVGQPVMTVDNMGLEQPEVLTGLGLGAAELYLVVSEKTGRKADGRKSYSLSRSLSQAQPGLEFEPNDSTATVQAVKIGEAVDGYHAPRGDQDWYEFNVYQKAVVVAEVSGLPAVKPALALHDQDLQPLASASAKKAGEPVSVERELEPGTYYLWLKPEAPEQNNVRDKYTLRVRAK